MSVCIEHRNCIQNYQNNSNNLTQHLPAADKIVKLPNSSFSTKLSIALLKMWYQRYHQRKHLARLDKRMLKDIGITPAEAYAESTKNFWK